MNNSCDISDKNEEDMPDDVYEVEKILEMRIVDGQELFKVKWAGWTDKFNDWHSLEELGDCCELLEDFFSKLNENDSPDDYKTVIKNLKKMKGREFKTFVSDGERLIISGFPKHSLEDRIKHHQFELRSWEEEIWEKCRLALIPPLFIENTLDLSVIPKSFVYITSNVAGEGVDLGAPAVYGCCNENDSGSGTRQCAASDKNSMMCLKDCECRSNADQGDDDDAESPAVVYNAAGCLENFKRNAHPLIFECNSLCKCDWKLCGNRVVQRGRQILLCVFRTQNKGWGLKALEDIPKGSFVAEYVGEVITRKEADRRGKEYDRQNLYYMLDTDFDEPEDEDPTNQFEEEEPCFTIDATTFGNEARFINHSCAPNMLMANVWVENLNRRLPRIAFFAARNIKKHEELTFDYNSHNVKIAGEDGNNENDVSSKEVEKQGGGRSAECRCGANNCRGQFTN